MSIALLAGVLALTQIGSIQAEDKKEPTVLNHKMKGLDGKEIDLAQYKGKVVLFVNVASKCGATPQYEGLQKLYETYSKDGLVVIGVPSNQFGKQEPGSDTEIAEFCASKYSVKFPMTSKVDVNGKDACELYKVLTSKDSKFGGEIKWNFTKFLVNRNGEVVQRFETKVKPEEMTKAIEAELSKK